MKKMSETIVFFGSGPVAAKSLELLAADFDIEAVVTKSIPEHHRGEFPVISLVETMKLKTFTPKNKRELSELISTNPFSSKIGVVIDYGLIIPQDVIDYFPLGIVNSHFSLLPEWRGADPITFSILSGQARTGVSLMLITAGLDEGPLLAQTPYDIPTGMTSPELTNELISLSHWSLKKILPLWSKGETKAMPQSEVTITDSKTPTYSRKLTKEDGLIDWTKSAEQLEREIRAYIEWPKSRTMIGGKEIIITSAKTADISGQPGSILTENKELIVCTSNKALKILKLKPAGKPEMTADAFLAGYRHLM